MIPVNFLIRFCFLLSENQILTQGNYHLYFFFFLKSLSFFLFLKQINKAHVLLLVLHCFFFKD